MNLASFIDSVEKRTLNVKEISDISLVIQIDEELAWGQISEERDELFSDIRKLDDDFIRKYMDMDSESRQKFAYAYQAAKRLGKGTAEALIRRTLLG